VLVSISIICTTPLSSHAVDGLFVIPLIGIADTVIGAAKRAYSR
jgi:hypothetical protein